MFTVFKKKWIRVQRNSSSLNIWGNLIKTSISLTKTCFRSLPNYYFICLNQLTLLLVHCIECDIVCFGCSQITSKFSRCVISSISFCLAAFLNSIFTLSFWFKLCIVFQKRLHESKLFRERSSLLQCFALQFVYRHGVCFNMKWLQAYITYMN